MNKSLPIPKQDQLQALSFGLKEVYRLLSEYHGDLNRAPDFRQYITVTKEELADYLRSHLQVAERHISQPSAPKCHEFPVLERVDGKFRVYEVYRGESRYEREFEDLAEAAAEYLMWGW